MRPINCTVADTKTARRSLPSKGGWFKAKYAYIVEARWREHRVCQWRLEYAPEHTSCPAMHDWLRIGVSPMFKVNEINQLHPSVEPPGVKSPLAHDNVTIACPVYGSSFSPSGRRTYCSDACRANAYRRRRSSGTLPTLRVPRSQPRREITVYECDSCAERSLGEQRCLA